MTCPHLQALLDPHAARDDGALQDYLDGELAPAASRLVGDHLGHCLSCRRRLAELEQLRNATAALPRSLAPPPELWAQIAVQLVPAVATRPAGWRRAIRHSGRWLPLAAAALLALATLALWSQRSPSQPDPLAGDVRPAALASSGLQADDLQTVEAEFRAARGLLLQALAARRGDLAPATLAVVDKNLALIDQAIGEIHAALAQHPDRPELQQLLAANYQRELDLLRLAARLPAT